MIMKYGNGGAVIDVQVGNPVLNSRMTQQEKIRIWAADGASDESLGLATYHLETLNAANGGEPVTLSSFVDLLVASGYVSPQRGAELKE